MKKLTLLLALALTSQFLFSQNVVEKGTKKIASEITKQLKELKDIGEIKIAVLNFAYKNEFSDSIKTGLGVSIAKNLEQALQLEISKQKSKAKVLTSNTSADEQMELGVTVPKGVNDGDFWEEYLGNITPNFYVTGTYEIVNNYSLLKLVNVKLRANKSQFELKDFAVKNAEITINDKDKLYLLNLETSETIKKMSNLIALKLKTQTKIKNIKLVNLVYEKNKLPSQFSEKLASELEQQLVNTANYQVQRNNTRGVFNRTDKTLHILSGTYSIENDKLKVNTVLINSETNMTVSTASAYLPISYLKNNKINYEPENVRQIKEQKQLLNKEVIENDFEVNVWTSKGNENVILKKDETITFTILAKERCYIRLIYILADGSAVLLLDNFEITNQYVGKAYQIPETFFCAEPFGAETLIMNAQTAEKFKPLRIENNYGYDFIQDNLETIIANNRRGIKREVKKAEKIISFVTIQ